MGLSPVKEIEPLVERFSTITVTALWPSLNNWISYV